MNDRISTPDPNPETMRWPGPARATMVLLIASTVAAHAACRRSEATLTGCEASVKRGAEQVARTRGPRPDVAALVARCIREGWSNDVRVCASHATTAASLDACAVGARAASASPALGARLGTAAAEMRAALVPSPHPVDEGSLEEPAPSSVEVPKAERKHRPAGHTEPAGVPQEVRGVFLSMAKAAFSSTNEHGVFPRATASLTPTTPCCANAGGRCPGISDGWRGPPWDELDFEFVEPHDFQFAYRSDGDTFEILAVGDPGCRGEVRTWYMEGGLAMDGALWTETASDE